MEKHLEFNYSYGVTKEQACIMCHISNDCGGCCVRCKAEGRNGTCYGQNCSQPSRDTDGQRWEAWMHLITTYDHLAYLKKYIPDKYRKSLGRKRHGQGNKTPHI